MADRNDLFDLANADTIGTERVATDLSNPLFVTAPAEDFDRLFILEKNTGQIKILNLATGTVNDTPFLDLDVSTTSEQGLLGLAFDPDYQQNGIFYANFTDPSGVSTIQRLEVSNNPDVADASSGEVISRIPQPFANHNGGWIGFGPDGYLYYATGDGGSGNDPQQNGQDLTTPLGAMLRIDVRSGADDFPSDPDRNYAIPSDNPFVGETADGEPVVEAIWSYGLRNPWRPSFDRETGDLYIADVGQDAREEINFQSSGSEGGENYGWRLREGDIETPGVGGNRPADNVDPIYDFTHGQGTFQGNSVTGGYVYRGPVSELQGQYVFGDFGTAGIWSFEVDGNGIADLTDRTSEFAPDQGYIKGISSFGEDAAGNLYIVDFFDGEVFRVVGPGDPPPLAPGLTLSISAASIAENGGGTTATVTRNTATSNDLIVSLNSSDTSEATVPSTVTILAGQTSANFGVSAADDTIADGSQQVTIAASAGGFAGGSDTVTVTDNETPGLTLSISAASIAENGGGTTATVTRNTATSNDLIVSLNSSDTSEATVPSTVTILAGQTSANFGVSAADDTIADGSQQVTIAASAGGFAGGSDTVTVTDNETPGLTLSISAASIAENGGGTTATVTRNTATSNDLIVSLNSSDTSEATVPSTVTILAGQTSANFGVSAADDTIADGSQQVTIAASAGGFSGGSDTVTVTDNETPGLTLSISAASIAENGGGTTATVTRNTATSNDLIVSLNSSDTSEATVPSTVTILAGQTSANFGVSAADDTIADGSQQVTIAASAGGFAGGSDTVTVTDNETPGLTLSISAASIAENGGGTTATVTRNTATSNDLIVSLNSSDTSEATVPSTVTILAGQTSANFGVSAADDTIADGSQQVTIAASAGGFAGGSDTVTVTDNDVGGIRVSFVGEDAGYQNSVGVYDMDTGRAEMLITNTDIQTNPDVMEFGKFLDPEAYSFDNLGYFIIPDGNRLNNWSEVDLDDLLVFENASGVYGVRDADGTVLSGTRADAFFSEMNKNPDNFDHVQSQGTQIGFEDMFGGGDQDFNDLVLDAREVLIEA